MPQGVGVGFSFSSSSGPESKRALHPASASLYDPNARPRSSSVTIFPPTFLTTFPPAKKFLSFKIGDSYFEVEDRYQNLKFMGQGSYGTVCSAYDQHTDSVVAIKKISNVFRVLADAKRCLREVKLLNHLKGHENIVSLIDFYVMPPVAMEGKRLNDIYLVMKKWPCDLDRIISSKQALSNQHIQLFLQQIIRATQYMHGCGIVHRDLKPSNILVDSDCNLVICDFGLSRGIYSSNHTPAYNLFHSKEKVHGDLTEYVVTRWYRPPELLCESTDFAFEMDIWSIGCIAAELFKRRPLFPGNSRNHQLQLILKLLGTPGEDESNFLKGDAARDIVSRFPKYKSQSFRKVFLGADTFLIDFLKRTLVFDPRRRMTVGELTLHPYVASINEGFLAHSSYEKFDNSFEDQYSSGLIPQKDLEALFLKEHFKYHPEDKAFINKLSNLNSTSHAENDDPNLIRIA